MTTSNIDSLAASFRGRYGTAEELAIAFIREAIDRGLLTPGQRLNQVELGASLGISRMPIVSAIRHLSAEGVLELLPRRGVTVRRLTEADLRELFDLRCLLESRLIRIAVENIGPSDIAYISDLAAKLDDADWHSYDAITMRVEFYDQLYGLANQPRGLQLVQMLRRQVGGYHLLSRVHRSGHSELIHLIRSGNGDGCVTWLENHISEISNYLQEQVAGETVEES